MTPERALLLNAPVASERLALEPLTREHAEALFEPLQHESIYRWISSIPPSSIEELQESWARREDRLSESGEEARLNWAVRRVSDGAYVGKMDAIVEGASVATNVGYMFFPAFWGLGYASEGLAALVSHLARHGVTRMWATVTLGNVASTRVLEKAGFVRTRIVPDNDTIRGVKYDDIEYALVVDAGHGRDGPQDLG